MSENCYVSICDESADFHCSCGLLICIEHITEHLKQEETQHCVDKYIGSLNQKEILMNLSSSIDEFLQSKCIQIDEVLQNREEYLLNQIKEAENRCLNKKEKYLNKSQELKDSISTIIDANKMPCISNEETIETVRNIKRKCEIDQELPQPTKKFKFMVGNYLEARINSSLCIRELFIYTVDENLNISHVQEDRFGMHEISNGLVLRDGTILLVEKNQAIRLCPKTKEIEVLPDLNYHRYYHTLGFVNELPAVIGGNYSNVMREVEVFDGEKWEQINSLVHPRSNASVCNSGHFTYVFGGFGTDDWDRVLDSIERYETNRWVVLNAKLPLPMADIGVVCYGSHFYLLGGQNYYCYYRHVYKWDGHHKWEICKDLMRDTFFRSNQWVVSGNSFISLDYEANVVEYSIDY